VADRDRETVDGWGRLRGIHLEAREGSTFSFNPDNGDANIGASGDEASGDYYAIPIADAVEYAKWLLGSLGLRVITEDEARDIIDTLLSARGHCVHTSVEVDIDEVLKKLEATR
jgi:hypothetical protein